MVRLKSVQRMLAMGSIVFAVIVLGVGCSSSNDGPVIKKFEATYTSVYPMGSTEIRCEAANPDGSPLIFRWSSNGGSFIGSGTLVTWNAPNSYGSYHIMVTVKNEKGDVTQRTLTITVVPQAQQDCPTCG
jgi:hypothetical protein